MGPFAQDSVEAKWVGRLREQLQEESLGQQAKPLHALAACRPGGLPGAGLQVGLPGGLHPLNNAYIL